jgi:hypothetical protein
MENQIQRQVEILQILNKPMGHELTVFSHLFANSDKLLNRHFWRSYEIEKEFYQIAIVKMDWLKDYCSINIQIDAEYPNLYIARNTKLQTGIAIEITSDETSILSAIFNLSGARPSALSSDLTDNPEVQSAIDKSFDYLHKRISHTSQPVLERTEAISLPLPSDEVRQYLPRLELLLQQGVEIRRHRWMPIKDGDVARRIRELGMYRDEAGYSIQGVYISTKRKHNRWEVLDPLERAQHEDRVLGQCHLRFIKLEFGLTIILRDKFQDTGAGTIIFLSVHNKTYLISLNEHDEFESSKLFESEVNLDDCPRYERKDMRNIIDKWHDGFRLDPLWERLLGLVYKRWEDVSIESLRKNLLNWLELVSDKE